MELSDEQKQRIADEERQRLAEEQYRAQVRRELLNQTGDTAVPVATVTPVTAKSKSFRSVIIVIGAVVVLCAGILVFSSRRQPGDDSASSPSTSDGQSKGAEKTGKPSPILPQKLTTAQIADLATPSVVVVENFNEDGEKVGQGSGYVCTADGTVITNYHVIRGAQSLGVRLPNKASVRVDSLLGYSIENDVAAIQIAEISVPPLATEPSQQIKVGDHVVAVGAPLGLESTVSEGIVSALRDVSGTHIIQTTASISPGSSGGPLLNEYGKVIGLTTAQMRDGQSLNFVVASGHISDLLTRQRRMTLAELLSETQVTDRLPASTISVPARNAIKFDFAVDGQQGAVLEGSYTINGGSGKDIAVALVSADGTTVVNSGRVSASGQFRQRLKRGRYAIIFDNRFSTFSSKSVTPELSLVHFR